MTKNLINLQIIFGEICEFNEFLQQQKNGGNKLLTRIPMQTNKILVKLIKTPFEA